MLRKLLWENLTVPSGSTRRTDSEVRRCKPLVRNASPVLGKPDRIFQAKRGQPKVRVISKKETPMHT